jgi:hypothetical protein
MDSTAPPALIGSRGPTPDHPQRLQPVARHAPTKRTREACLTAKFSPVRIRSLIEIGFLEVAHYWAPDVSEPTRATTELYSELGTLVKQTAPRLLAEPGIDVFTQRG